MKTVKQSYSDIKKDLNSSLETRMLLQHQLKMTYEELLLKGETAITTNDLQALQSLVKRRLAKEPIAYITGIKEFYGLDFFVTKDTLIPRPDSETLIEAVLTSYAKNFTGTIIDLGTGSGCLIITLLKYLPNAFGIAVDISEEALKIVDKNAKNHHVSNRLTLINDSWNNLLNIKGDILISNPPYIEKDEIKYLQDDVKNYEPITALDGGLDGLDCYREIFEISKKILNQNYDLFIEIGYTQSQSIETLAKEKGLVVTQNYHDLNKIIRCLKLQIYSDSGFQQPKS